MHRSEGAGVVMGDMGACVGALSGGAAYTNGLRLLGNHEMKR